MVGMCVHVYMYMLTNAPRLKLMISQIGLYKYSNNEKINKFHAIRWIKPLNYAFTKTVKHIEPIAHIIINNMHIVVYNVGTETSLCINVRFLQKYIDVYCVRLL